MSTKGMMEMQRLYYKNDAGVMIVNGREMTDKEIKEFFQNRFRGTYFMEIVDYARLDRTGVDVDPVNGTIPASANYTVGDFIETIRKLGGDAWIEVKEEEKEENQKL